jgi:RNA polymerase sigma factor (sigma-70 family)
MENYDYDYWAKKHAYTIENYISKIGLYSSRIGQGWDIDDLRQAGRLAIWEAIEKFDPTKGVKLNTYIISMIRWKMNSYFDRVIRPWKKRNEYSVEKELKTDGGKGIECCLELDRTYTSGNGNEIPFCEAIIDSGLSIMDDTIDNVCAEEMKGRFIEVVSKMNETCQAVARMRYLGDEPRTMLDIGDELGLSKQRISQIVAKIEERVERKKEYILNGNGHA